MPFPGVTLPGRRTTAPAGEICTTIDFGLFRRFSWLEGQEDGTFRLPAGQPGCR